MGKILYLIASPMGARSHSIAVADAFIAAYKEKYPDTKVATKELFACNLPAFDESAAGGRYAIMHGTEHTIDEQAAWWAVQQIVTEFLSADTYVIASPMWNFGIPYELKHYIDLVVQPKLTFEKTDTGYNGLVKNAKAFLAVARGGEFPEPALVDYDFQERYLRLVLGFMGITNVHSVQVEPMMAKGREVASQVQADCMEKARAIARGI